MIFNVFKQVSENHLITVVTGTVFHGSHSVAPTSVILLFYFHPLIITAVSWW